MSDTGVRYAIDRGLGQPHWKELASTQWAETWLASRPWARYDKAQWAAFARLMAWLETVARMHGAEGKVAERRPLSRG